MEQELARLRKIAVRLRDLDESELADKVLCAIAALTDAEEPRADLSYSYVMRELRKTKNKEKVREFQKTFKEAFDEAVDNNIEDPASIALMTALEQNNLEF